MTCLLPGYEFQKEWEKGINYFVVVSNVSHVLWNTVLWLCNIFCELNCFLWYGLIDKEDLETHKVHLEMQNHCSFPEQIRHEPLGVPKCKIKVVKKVAKAM